MSNTDRRIPSLDGMRGFLISIVLFVHIAGTRNFPISREAVPMDIGYLALRVFFVISGFLITGILLNEIKRRNTIDLKRFYMKRAFRIFPAYYALLITVAVLTATGLLQLRPGDLFHALTYTANYNADHSWYLGHAWSLSVEEQFYFMWPAILLLAGVRRGAWMALGFAMLVPLWRILLLALPAGQPGFSLFQLEFGHTFDTVGDTIAIGCLLAILRPQLWELGWYRRFLSGRAMLLLPVFALGVQSIPGLATRIEGIERYALLTAYEGILRPLVNVALAMMVDWAMRFPDGRVGRWLNHPAAIRVGVMSYSIYLWQQLFLNRHSDHLFASFPLNLVLTFTIAWASHSFVETPFLAMRERIDARRRARQTAPAKAGDSAPVLEAPTVAVGTATIAE